MLAIVGCLVGLAWFTGQLHRVVGMILLVGTLVQSALVLEDFILQGCKRLGFVVVSEVHRDGLGVQDDIDREVVGSPDMKWW